MNVVIALALIAPRELHCYFYFYRFDKFYGFKNPAMFEIAWQLVT